MVELVAPAAPETKQMRRRRELDAVIDRCARRAVKHIDSLLAPGVEGDRSEHEATMRDRAAELVYKGYMKIRRDDNQVKNELGVIILKHRLSASDWEKHAQDVDGRVLDVGPKK